MQGGQLEEPEVEVEVPLRLDVLRGPRGVRLLPQARRKDQGHDGQQVHQQHPDHQLRRGVFGPEPEVALPLRRLLPLELQLRHPVQPDEQDVQAEQDERDRRQDADVEDEEPGQRVLPHLRPPPQEVADVGPRQGDRRSQVARHRGPPEAELLIDQRIPREPERQRRPQQQKPDAPVELPRVAVGPGKIHPEHVQKDRHDHEIGRPLVERPDVPPEPDLPRDRGHALVCLGRGGHVVERQRDARHDLHDEQVEHRAPQAEPPLLEVIGHRLRPRVPEQLPVEREERPQPPPEARLLPGAFHRRHVRPPLTSFTSM